MQILLVVLGVGLTYTLWDRRGAIAGIVAFAIYGIIFGLGAIRHEELRAWTRAHPGADSALLIPLVFLALANSTDLSLALCALLGVAAWLALLPLTHRRRRE